MELPTKLWSTIISELLTLDVKLIGLMIKVESMPVNNNVELDISNVLVFGKSEIIASNSNKRLLAFKIPSFRIN